MSDEALLERLLHEAEDKIHELEAERDIAMQNFETQAQEFYKLEADRDRLLEALRDVVEYNGATRIAYENLVCGGAEWGDVLAVLSRRPT